MKHFAGERMEIKEIAIKEIIPYKNNPRKNDNAVETVAKSIFDFGFKNPILIDKNNVIVCGHTRYKAAKKLKFKTVPCIIADDLTDEQIKQFRIVDNKSAELAEWEIEKLMRELDDLDLSDFDFDFDFGVEQSEQEEKTEEVESGTLDIELKENENERTFEKYNLDLYDESEAEGEYQMPIIRGIDFIPNDLVGFNYALSSKNKDVGIHCFLDDYQFERLWNNPFDYIDNLLEYQCFLSPDFSLYLDMPVAMKIWNVYRSRLIGQVYQQHGVTVIPTVSWAEKETFKFCFDGLPKNATLAVSTIGVKTNKTAMQIWKDGMDAMIEKLTPKNILVYGGKVEYDYKNINVIYFDNKVTEGLKNGR